MPEPICLNVAPGFKELLPIGSFPYLSWLWWCLARAALLARTRSSPCGARRPSDPMELQEEDVDLRRPLLAPTHRLACTARHGKANKLGLACVAGGEKWQLATCGPKHWGVPNYPLYLCFKFISDALHVLCAGNHSHWWILHTKGQ